ncbi:MAG: PEP-CTERM sorting domain-containing protein [Rhodoferax sp.]|nr:PEP-CTERM sorting domain-containing protein [Rhodoferax sp.]
MKFSRSLSALALSLTTLGAQATELVVNGSFEANAQAAGTWQIYNALTGWTSGLNGIELRNNVAGTAQDGVNFVELDTTKNSAMYQTITGTGLVTLSFWYSARPNTGLTNGLGYSLGTFSGSVLNWAINPSSANHWHHYSSVVDLGTSGSSVLSFYARGPSDSYGGSIDNISVTSAVPEPESYGMLLAGMGLIGAVARRRQGKASAA